MSTVIYGVTSILLIVIGLISLVLPFIPGGVPLAWLGLFVFAIGTGFTKISILATVIFFIVMVITMIIDFFLPILGAGKYKASKWGILGSIFGSFLGIFIWGLWGTVVGPFLGAVFGELATGRDHKAALRIGLGTIIGLIVGGILKIIVVLVMLGWVIAAWI